jgi:hypothetical protein
MLQFLQRAEQVSDRAAPPIQAPHQHPVDLPAACRFQQFLASLPLGRAGADLFDSEGFPGQAEHLSRYGRLTFQVEKVPKEAHYPCEHPGHAERDRLVSRLDATCCKQIADYTPERSFFSIRHEVGAVTPIHRQQKRVDKIVDVRG